MRTIDFSVMNIDEIETALRGIYSIPNDDTPLVDANAMMRLLNQQTHHWSCQHKPAGLLPAMDVVIAYDQDETKTWDRRMSVGASSVFCEAAAIALFRAKGWSVVNLDESQPGDVSHN